MHDFQFRKNIKLCHKNKCDLISNSSVHTLFDGFSDESVGEIAIADLSDNVF